jgi:hypothetical protein
MEHENAAPLQLWTLTRTARTLEQSRRSLLRSSICIDASSSQMDRFRFQRPRTILPPEGEHPGRATHEKIVALLQIQPIREQDRRAMPQKTGAALEVVDWRTERLAAAPSWGRRAVNPPKVRLSRFQSNPAASTLLHTPRVGVGAIEIAPAGQHLGPNP